MHRKPHRRTGKKMLFGLRELLASRTCVGIRLTFVSLIFSTESCSRVSCRASDQVVLNESTETGNRKIDTRTPEGLLELTGIRRQEIHTGSEQIHTSETFRMPKFSAFTHLPTCGDPNSIG